MKKYTVNVTWNNGEGRSLDHDMHIIARDEKSARKTEGIMMTEEMWKEFLVEKARLAYFVQPRKTQRFLEENQLV